jgi:hypothetical protein
VALVSESVGIALCRSGWGVSSDDGPMCLGSAYGIPKGCSGLPAQPTDGLRIRFSRGLNLRVAARRNDPNWRLPDRATVLLAVSWIDLGVYVPWGGVLQLPQGSRLLYTHHTHHDGWGRIEARARSTI